MTYHLYLGERAYSSWSLRGWLVAEMSGLPRETHWVDFLSKDVAEQLKHVAPARTVPTLVTPEGAIISESLAIAEELATRAPDAGLWPADPRARAIARGLACEMHSGFGALRSACPMNLRVAYADFTASDAVRADVARIEEIWAYALAETGGPWLGGATYSIADAFYAPVAARFATYGLGESATADAYVGAHLNHGPFRRWRAMGTVRGPDLPWYAMDHTQRAWPGPARLEARAVADGSAALNSTCPYSGDPVADFMELDGQIWGFCNPFCRDKTVADPEAWPAFLEMRARR